jgi:hypothetical protein
MIADPEWRAAKSMTNALAACRVSKGDAVIHRMTLSLAFLIWIFCGRAFVASQVRPILELFYLALERNPVIKEGRRTQKRLHDLRGAFTTRIMTHPKAILSNKEVASTMGGSAEQVGQIRKRYVDDRAIVVSITRRLGG